MINYLIKKVFNPVSFYIFVLAIFFFDTIFLGKTYFLRDLTFIFHPWKMLVTQYVQNGKMPLWDHYAYCGMPLLANWQSSVFYPFNMLFSFFRFTTALKFFFFTQMFAGGIFTYLFSRQNGLNKWQSLGTAILFSLNGYMITKMEFLSYFATDIWIFAMLLFRKNPVILALTISIAFFAGHQIFVCLLIILFFYYFVDFNIPESKSIFKNLFAAGFLSLGFAACQIIPTLELAKVSERTIKGIEPMLAMWYSLKLPDLFNIFCPFLILNKSAIYLGEKFGWTNGFHVGFIASLFIIWKTIRSPLSRSKIMGFFFFIMGILLSLGNTTPVYPWAYKHFFSLILIRYPFKLMIFSIVGIIILLQEYLKKFRLAPLIIFLITIELLIFSWNFQPKLDNSYFSKKPATINFFENNFKNSRFMLSPGTENDRIIKSKSIFDAWERARDFLYGLVSLPYHIPCANGLGEPMAPALISALINKAYTEESPQKAIPFYKKLGIKYLICRNKLKNDSGYSLELSSFLNIYSIKGVPEVALLPEKTNVKDFSISYGKIRMVIDSSKKTDITFSETYLPGWRTYINNKFVPTYTSNEGFKKFEIEEGENKIWQIYMPESFKIGLIISIIFICGILIFSIIKLNQKIQ